MHRTFCGAEGEEGQLNFWQLPFCQCAIRFILYWMARRPTRAFRTQMKQSYTGLKGWTYKLPEIEPDHFGHTVQVFIILEYRTTCELHFAMIKLGWPVTLCLHSIQVRLVSLKHSSCLVSRPAAAQMGRGLHRYHVHLHI